MEDINSAQVFEGIYDASEEELIPLVEIGNNGNVFGSL